MPVNFSTFSSFFLFFLFSSCFLASLPSPASRGGLPEPLCKVLAPTRPLSTLSSAHYTQKVRIVKPQKEGKQKSAEDRVKHLGLPQETKSNAEANIPIYTSISKRGATATNVRYYRWLAVPSQTERERPTRNRRKWGDINRWGKNW